MMNEQNLHQWRKKLRETALFLLDVLYNAVIIIVLVVIIRSFLLSPFKVAGSSMADTLHDKEFILIDKFSYLIGDVDRGDPIVFLPPAVSKDKPKFEQAVQTNSSGSGRLELKKLRGKKENSYCQNKLISVLWLCKKQPESGDLVYFAPQKKAIGSSVYETDWTSVRQTAVSREDLKEGHLEFSLDPDQTYTVRIYSSKGLEYFVKRVIGVPGDTVKIENGRVYIKGPEDIVFTEIKEEYLNQENLHRTYISQSHRQNVYTVPEGHYFVMGDNRNHSNDSRSWLEPITQEPFPFVPEENISGKVLVVLWPMTDMRVIRASGGF